MTEANIHSQQTQFAGLVLTEGLKPECPPGVEYCNEPDGNRWRKARCLINRLLVPHVIVIGDLQSLGLMQLFDEAEHCGLDVTMLPQGAEVASALP